MAAGVQVERGSYEPYLARAHLRLLATADRPGFEQIDGTLVFADVSGFTPLTERLARRGKIGAEELTDVLNQIFGALLDHAAAHGGDLLKFGGDALLLLFDGDGHEQRACAAALAMQGALRPYRRFRTAGGIVSLRMSVGVSSGPLLLLLVGDSHQELLVAGPTMSRLVELESAADAGEVLVSERTAGGVEPRWLSGTERAGGFLLRRNVQVLPPPQVEGGPAAGHPAPKVEGPDAADGIPEGLRERLAFPSEDGEHRVAVLTFLQFKGVDALLDAQGPGAVCQLLHELVTAAQRAAGRHGVTFLATDLDKDGGKLLFAAGAPTSWEDDEDRTLAAVLEILAAAPRALAVRAGVNRGRAFAVDIGNERRRTYAVMGDPTNLAARVMGKAPAGGVLATAAVLEHVRVRYDVVHLAPFAVKGKSELIDAAHVRQLTVRRRAATADVSDLVGRKTERRVLERVVRGARSGQGAVVELVGEAGLGKSRLTRHLVAEAEGMNRFEVEATHYASASPYLVLRGPLRQAFTGLEAELGDEVTLQLALTSFAPHLLPYTPLLATLFGLDLPDTPETAAIDPTFRRSTLHQLTTEILRAALPEPTLLVVEDAHWLDEASADLLATLCASIDERPWAVCLTRRPGPRPVRLPATTTTIELHPLAGDDARTMVESSAVSLPPSVVATLVERSGGSPLFLLELIRAVERGAPIDELPDSVEASIAGRIDALDADDRSVLRQAAVLGARFTVPVLAGLLGTTEAEASAAVARLGGFIDVEDGESCRFQHALVRECAYEGLPFRRRRELHARAGRIIEARFADDLDEWSDLLSLHFAQAGEDDRAYRYSCTAGGRAWRAYAPVEAAAYFRRAADAARRLPGIDDGEVSRIYETLGDCYRYSGTYADAVAAYGRARRTAVDRVRLADLHRKEGIVRERTGRFSDAVRWYRRGQEVLTGLEDARVGPTKAQLLVTMGAARLRQGRYLDGIPILENAATLAATVGDRETEAHAYDLLDWAHTDLGNEERHRYRELALPIYVELGNLQRQGVVASNLGIDAYFEGRWSDAVSWYERGREASERAGDVVQMATAVNNLGEVESDRGDLDRAKKRFQTALRIWRDAPFPIGVALATSNLGRVAVRAGELDRAKELLDEAREAFAHIGAESYVLETDVRELERLVAAAQPEPALALAAEISVRSERAGGLALQMLPADRARAYALAQRGDLELARTALEAVADRARALGATFELALTLEASARVAAAGGDRDAEPLAIAAARLFDELGVRSTPPIPLDAVPVPA